MAHNEGGVITALEARELAVRINTVGRTPEELKDRYRVGLKEIQTAAEQGRYAVALRVGTDDYEEFSDLVTAQGFRIFQNSTTPEGTKIVNDDAQGDIVDIEVNWSVFEFTQSTTSLQRPDGVTLFVRVEGYPIARPLYYTFTGTLINTDFVGDQDEGEITFDNTGEGGIFVNVKPGGTRVGKKVQVLVYYDENRETLLHSYNEITVIV